MKITILGCGASSGSPLIGGEWPSNPKNVRTRASIFIEGESTNILIDTSPDLRMQAIVNKITRIDAVLFTHAHADHTHGVDDMKSFNYTLKAPIPAYSNAETLKELEVKFDYCFRPPTPEYGWFRPCLTPIVIEPLKPFTVGEFEIMPFRQIHTKTMDSLGFRIGNFTYSTDVKYFPPESESQLKNLDLWIVDSLKKYPAPTHSDLKQTLEWIKKYAPRKSVLTHLSHEIDYDEVAPNLPNGVALAYDNMIIGL
jgi:phosphoribosyl 1,2-cyclic phosphate phosphodiesterase